MSTHPAWCSPQYCGVDPDLPTDGGEHRSEPCVVTNLQDVMSNRGAVSGSGVAYLTKSAQPWTTDTYLHLEADGEHLTVPLAQAAAILAQLTDLIHKGTK